MAENREGVGGQHQEKHGIQTREQGARPGGSAPWEAEQERDREERHFLGFEVRILNTFPPGELVLTGAN